MNFKGSDAGKQARIYLATFGIDYDAITKERFVNVIDVLKLSKYMKSPPDQRGVARQDHTSRTAKEIGNGNKQKSTPYPALEGEYGVFFR